MLRAGALAAAALFIAPTLLPAQATISTTAGTGTGGYNGDGIAAISAELNTPFSAVADSSGNLYIADTLNQRIRKVAANGTITTVAGKGTAGSGSGQLDHPSSVADAANGDLFIADSYNNRILRLGAANGAVQVIAGNGTAGSAGDGGLAINAELQRPFGVAVAANGDLYIADTYNQRVRQVDATTGKISTIAGTGVAGYNGDGVASVSAELNYPEGVAVDKAGSVYIADTVNGRVRKLDTTGNISTVAGTGVAGYNGDAIAAVSAELAYPVGLAFDSTGNLYIADSGNQRVREVATTGNIDTVAGNGVAGYAGDASAAGSAELNSPTGVSLDGHGNLYIADSENHRIRSVGLATNSTPKLTLSPSGGFSFPPEPVGSSSPAQSFTVTNTGAGNLVLGTLSNSNPTVFALQADGCSGQTLAPAAACEFSLTFIPALTGQIPSDVNIPFLDTVTVFSNAAPATQTLQLTGTGLLQASNTRLYSGTDPQFAGSKVSFTAVVSATAGGGMPTGTVKWEQASLSGGSATMLGQTQLINGQTIFKTAALAVGGSMVAAYYSGSQTFASSFATLTQVTQAPLSAITAVSGSGQTLGQGSAFLQPLVAQVVDVYGAPVAGVPVQFRGRGLTFNNGGSVITDADGHASVIAYANSSGAATALATVAGLKPASFSLTTGKASYLSPMGTFYAAGSSAQFNTFALAASNVNGLCGSNHWTQRNPGGAAAITVSDPRDAYIPPQGGDIWIIWNDQAASGQAGGIVCYYVAVDSVVAMRLYQARGIVNLPAGLIASPDANIVPFLSGNPVPLPASIQAVVNGSAINVGLSDIRPEDTKFAANRALTSYGALMNGSGYTGVGYQGALASPWNGQPILSAVSQAAAYPVDYAFAPQDLDPVNGLLPVRPYQELPIGAAPVLVIANVSQTGSGHLGDGNYTNVNTYALSNALVGSVSRTRDLATLSEDGDQPLHVWIEDPLSGAYNVADFSVPNSHAIAGARAQGYGRVTGQESGVVPTNSGCAGGQPCTVESGNPLYHLFGSSAGGPASRGRVIGTNEMIATVNSNADSLGYAFWGYGNFAAAANLRYLTVNGTDPLFSAMNPNPNGPGALPQCSSVPCVPPFHNVQNGSYPIWSIYRMVYDNTDTSSLATNLVTLAQTAATTLYGDFVPAPALHVFHSHFAQVVTTGGDGYAANNGFLSGRRESGGDMGGPVLTVQSELDFIADTGGDQQIGLNK